MGVVRHLSDSANSKLHSPLMIAGVNDHLEPTEYALEYSAGKWETSEAILRQWNKRKVLNHSLLALSYIRM
jgi:hypothetical protein